MLEGYFFLPWSSTVEVWEALSSLGLYDRRSALCRFSVELFNRLFSALALLFAIAFSITEHLHCDVLQAVVRVAELVLVWDVVIALTR